MAKNPDSLNALRSKLCERIRFLIQEADDCERKMEDFKEKAMIPLKSLEDARVWINAYHGEKTVHNCTIREINFLREALGEKIGFHPVRKELSFQPRNSLGGENARKR